MDNFKSTIQLLSLIIIFFIYKAISALFFNEYTEFILWFLISIIYAVSLIILYIVFRKRKK